MTASPQCPGCKSIITQSILDHPTQKSPPWPLLTDLEMIRLLYRLTDSHWRTTMNKGLTRQLDRPIHFLYLILILKAKKRSQQGVRSGHPWLQSKQRSLIAEQHDCTGYKMIRKVIKQQVQTSSHANYELFHCWLINANSMCHQHKRNWFIFTTA